MIGYYSDRLGTVSRGKELSTCILTLVWVTPCAPIPSHCFYFGKGMEISHYNIRSSLPGLAAAAELRRCQCSFRSLRQWIGLGLFDSSISLLFCRGRFYFVPRVRHILYMIIWILISMPIDHGRLSSDICCDFRFPNSTSLDLPKNIIRTELSSWGVPMDEVFNFLLSNTSESSSMAFLGRRRYSFNMSMLYWI